MKKICIWHQLYYPNEKPPVLGKSKTVKGSYGMCEKCKKKWEKEKGEEGKAKTY